MAANTILIVDDEEIIHESIKDALEDEGYEIVSAFNGEDGILRCREKKPVLIILDLKMPVMDGIGFLTKLEVKPTDAFSVIVLTGHGDSGAMEKCYDLGIRAFLRKPFDIYELRALVQSCIALKVAECTLTSEVSKREDAEKQLGEYREHLNRMFDSLKM